MKGAQDEENSIIYDNLEMYLQPIVRTEDKQIKYVEALARVGNNRDISNTIAIIEHKGLHRDFDRKVLDKSIIIYNNILHDKNIGIAINITKSTIEEHDAWREILSIVERAHNKKNIIIEINENTDYTNVYAKDNIKQLSENNVKIAIDDFKLWGNKTNNLNTREVAMIKMDKCMQKIGGKREPKLKNFIGLLNQLGMETVAEGVEHPRNYDKAREMGYKLIQGYLIGIPMTVDGFKCELENRYTNTKGMYIVDDIK